MEQQDQRSRYEQAARDIVKGADPAHIARVRQLDPELLRKYVAYAWEKVNSGQYKMNRPNLEENQDYCDACDRVITSRPHVCPGNESDLEQRLAEDLRKWFKEKWVRFGPDGKIRGDCARGDDSEGKPKCLPQSKAHALGKKGRASAAARKRRQDPNPERKGKAINVATKNKTNEASQVNLNTAKSVARDLRDAVLELQELVKSGQKTGALIQLRQEIHGLRQQLNNLGYDYDPRNSKIVPLTIDNQPTVKLREQPIQSKQSMHVNDYLKQAEELHSRMLAASKSMDVSEFERLKKERAELDARARQGLVAEYQCSECGGPAFTNRILAEKQDACYHKVKSRYKVWPSAYASGALVQCRKKGAANWGNKSKNESVAEAQSAKTGIYQTDVLGAKAYHAKCMEPKCNWESKRFDKIKQAQAAAEKHAKSHFKQGVAESNDDDVWGPQGRFAGDVKTNISTIVKRPEFAVGQRVRVNDGRLQGTGEITKILGDRATVWIDSYARTFEVPLKSLSAATIRESKSAISAGIYQIKK